MQEYTVTLTEEQVMIVLAALSDRNTVLSNLAIGERHRSTDNAYTKAREQTIELNLEIRRQTGRM